jgi:peptidoglycan hydrolase-like protein with peptidoglycan-binding domain
MSRSYRVLVLALVGVLVLVGLAQLVKRDEPASSGAGAALDTTPATAATSAVGATTPAVATGDTQAVTDPEDGDVTTSSTTAPPVTADCTVTAALKLGSTGAEVACLEQQLATAGLLAAADGTFDTATDQAVRAFQTSKALSVDGVAGKQTAQAMGIWAGPLGPAPATDADCPSTGHGAIVDRANQRGALCDNGTITYQFPITSAWSQPDPGHYPVFAKDMKSSSNFDGQYSEMTHFVAFTRGKYTGARIAFHSVPTLPNGQLVQPLDSVGTAEHHGDSHGCIRVKYDDSVKIWNWLAKGDEVHVIS